MGRLSVPPSPLMPAASAASEPIRRGSARERGYTARWDKASKAFLRANPLCRGCDAVGRVELSTVTDHVIPHRGDRRLFWDPANRQALCRWHHDVVKQVLERDYLAGLIGTEDLWLDSPRAVAETRRAQAQQGRGG